MFPENSKKVDPDPFREAVDEVSRKIQREVSEKTYEKEKELKEKDELVGELYSSLSSPQESLAEVMESLDLDFETNYRKPGTVLKEELPDVYKEINSKEIMDRYGDADSVVLQLFLSADLDRELPEVLSSKERTRELYQRIKDIF